MQVQNESNYAGGIENTNAPTAPETGYAAVKGWLQSDMGSIFAVFSLLLYPVLCILVGASVSQHASMHGTIFNAWHFSLWAGGAYFGAIALAGSIYSTYHAIVWLEKALRLPKDAIAMAALGGYVLWYVCKKAFG